MKIDFISNGELGNLIVTVLNPDDIFEVVKTLEFLEKFLCVNLSYDVDFNYNEVHVTVDDYYEYQTLRRKIFDHCCIACMRVSRVLVLNKWRRCAPPDKHTRNKLIDRLTKRKTKLAGGAFALNRLQIAPRFPSSYFSFFNRFLIHPYHVSYIFAFVLSRPRLLRLCIRLRPSRRNYRITVAFYLLTR